MRLFFFASAALALALGSVACGGSPDQSSDSSESDVKGATTIQLTSKDDGKTIKVNEGQSVALTLSQNASTGYLWSVSDDGGLGTAKEVTHAGDTSKPGAPGTDVFTWKTANKTGSFTLSLIYQRPWAETSPPAQTFTVTLDITGTTASKTCGGIAGLTCGKGQFCDYSAKAMCGAGDQSGTCTDLPDLCPEIVMPVCGCDGKTYNNSCEANRGGVAVASNGECVTTPPAKKACGGIAGIQCGSGEFCDYSESAMCGAGDQSGTCTPRPDLCSHIVLPVCGCDGNTYNNACEANRGNVSVASQGACK